MLNVWQETLSRTRRITAPLRQITRLAYENILELMTTTTKTLLLLAFAGLGSGLALDSGLVDATNASDLFVFLPLGAVFFGLFLLSKLLEKETAAFDREREAALAAADAAAVRTPALRAAGQEAAAVEERELLYR